MESRIIPPYIESVLIFLLSTENIQNDTFSVQGAVLEIQNALCLSRFFLFQDRLYKIKSWNFNEFAFFSLSTENL